jgi:hypothetical protein
MNPIHERIHAVVEWESLTMRTAGPLALYDRLRALSRAAASLQPGLAERLGLRPEVTVRCFEKSSVAVWIRACAGMTEYLKDEPSLGNGADNSSPSMMKQSNKNTDRLQACGRLW